MSQNINQPIQSLVFSEAEEQALSELMQRSKPHLIVTEQELMQVPFGEITITYTMRAGKVSKMVITQSKSWLADKS